MFRFAILAVRVALEPQGRATYSTRCIHYMWVCNPLATLEAEMQADEDYINQLEGDDLEEAA